LGIPAAIDPKNRDPTLQCGSELAPTGLWLKLHSRHLEGLPLEITALAAPLSADAGVMAFTHHELSVEKAVIPFSLHLPTSSSPAGPATFEMEHFQ
jgi:hypothetical protein